MRYQAIQYDPATGQIRQVLDPHLDLDKATGRLVEIPGVVVGPEVVKLLNPEAHEAVHAYLKRTIPCQKACCPGNVGLNRYHEWQEEITRITGKIPEGLHPDIVAHVRAHP